MASGIHSKLHAKLNPTNKLNGIKEKTLIVISYSDHRPIEVRLETNTKQWQSTDLDNKIKALEDQSPGYKWDNSSSSSNSNRLYRDQQLSEESMGAIKVLMDRPIESKDDVSHLHSSLNDECSQ